MEQEDLIKGSVDRKHIMGYDLLPSEIQVYILSKISVVDMRRLMSVCKLWFNVITKDHDFALFKLAPENRPPTSRFSILVDRHHGGCNVKRSEHGWRCNTSHYLEFEVNKDGVIATHKQYLSLDIRNAPMIRTEDRRCVGVVCCCDGIVVSRYQSKGKGFFICNPITGLSVLLSPVSIEFDFTERYCSTIWGLGYYNTVADPIHGRNGANSKNNSRKYKLVGLRYTGRESAITSIVWHTLGNDRDHQGQSSSTTAWKGLKMESGCILVGHIQHQVVFSTNGTVNWICCGTDMERVYLLSFDLRDEKMKATSCSNIPASMATRSILRKTCLLGMSGSLYLIFPPTSAADCNMEIWTMKDWDSMTWVKTYVIEAQSLVQIVSPGCPAGSVRRTLGAYDVFPLGITMNASELILRYSSLYHSTANKACIVAYDLATGRLRALRFGLLHENFISFLQGDKRDETEARKRDRPGGRLGDEYDLRQKRLDIEYVSFKFHVNTLVNWSVAR